MKLLTASLRFVLVAGLAVLIISLILFPPQVKDALAFFTNEVSAIKAPAAVAQPVPLTGIAKLPNYADIVKASDPQAAPKSVNPEPVQETTPYVPVILPVATPDVPLDESKLSAKDLGRWSRTQAKYMPTRVELRNAQYLFEAAYDVRTKLVTSQKEEADKGYDTKQFDDSLRVFDGFVNAAKVAQQRGFDMIYNKYAFTPSGEIVNLDNAIVAVYQGHLNYLKLRYDLQQAYLIAHGTYLYYQRKVDKDIFIPDISSIDLH
jgi:hypothetical protein